MQTEAIKAGFYQTPYGKHPKIQLLTIAELFAGKKPNSPLIDSTVFRKAAAEPTAEQDELFDRALVRNFQRPGHRARPEAARILRPVLGPSSEWSLPIALGCACGRFRPLSKDARYLSFNSST
jgi:hypothetical protein